MLVCCRHSEEAPPSHVGSPTLQEGLQELQALAKHLLAPDQRDLVWNAYMETWMGGSFWAGAPQLPDPPAQPRCGNQLSHMQLAPLYLRAACKFLWVSAVMSGSSGAVAKT